MKNPIYPIGKQYWRKKSRSISYIFALQMALILFILSIGISLIEGINFNLGFSKESVYFIEPKAGKYEEVKNLLKNCEQIDKVIAGTSQNVRSKVFFFSCGGTLYVKMKKEDLSEFIQSYDIKLVKGSMPENSKELVASSQSIYQGKSKIGECLGEGIGLDTEYKVSGCIKGRHNILLGITDKEEVLMVLYKKNVKDDVKAFLEAHHDLYEKRFGEDEVDEFLELLIRNLGFIGVIIEGLFVLQMNSTLNRLLDTYYNKEMNEIALFHILGYNRKQVRGRLILQSGWIYFIGAVGGYLLGECCIVLFYYLYCEPRGIFLILWHIIYLLVPILLGTVLFIKQCMKINRKINEIEWNSLLQR